MGSVYVHVGCYVIVTLVCANPMETMFKADVLIMHLLNSLDTQANTSVCILWLVSNYDTALRVLIADVTSMRLPNKRNICIRSPIARV